MNEPYPQKNEKTEETEGYLSLLPIELQISLPLFLDANTLTNLISTYPYYSALMQTQYYESLIQTKFLGIFSPDLRKLDIEKMKKIKIVRDKANETLLTMHEEGKKEEKGITREDYFNNYFYSFYNLIFPQLNDGMKAAVEADDITLLDIYFKARIQKLADTKHKDISHKERKYDSEYLLMLLAHSLDHYSFKCFKLILSYCNYFHFEFENDCDQVYYKEGQQQNSFKRLGINLAAFGLRLIRAFDGSDPFFSGPALIEPAIVMALLEFLQKCIFETVCFKEALLLIGAATAFFDHNITTKMNHTDLQFIIPKLTSSCEKLVRLIATFCVLNNNLATFKFILENFHPSINFLAPCDHSRLISIFREKPALTDAGLATDFIPSQQIHKNSIPFENSTLLVIAAKQNLLPFIKLLLEYGADPQAVDSSGNPVADYPTKDRIKTFLKRASNNKDNSIAPKQLTESATQQQEILEENQAESTEWEWPTTEWAATEWECPVQVENSSSFFQPHNPMPSAPQEGPALTKQEQPENESSNSNGSTFWR